MEFRIYSGRAGRGKPMQSEHTGFIYAAGCFCWRRGIKVKCTLALGTDEAEPRRKKRWQLHALLVPQECQKRPKTVLSNPLAAKWDTSTSWQLIWTEKARHVAPQVSPRGCQKKTNFEDFLVPFFGPHSECTFGGFQTRNGSQNVTQNGALPEMADLAQV